MTALGRSIGTLVMAGIIAVASSENAQAHGPSQILVGTTLDGGGALEGHYEFDTIVPVTFVAEIAGTSLYTSDEPSFDALDADDLANDHYVLDDGTQVGVEITALDEGKTAMKVNGNVLDAVGESAVIATFNAADPAAFHRHPEWQLLLELPAGVYGSGTISFKLTTTSPSYTASESYTLTLSNGHLPHFAFDSAAVDKASLNCQKTVGNSVRAFVATEHKNLTKCLDKAQVVEAYEAASLDAGSAESAADAACSNKMLDKINAARQKAVDAITKKCGAAGSVDLGAEAVASHVSFASCQAEGLIAASYPGAKDLLETHVIGGQPGNTYFPCL
jgi:hypothetical protein